MKKRFSTKLLSTILSTAVVLSGMVVAPLSAKAEWEDRVKAITPNTSDPDNNIYAVGSPYVKDILFWNGAYSLGGNTTTGFSGEMYETTGYAALVNHQTGHSNVTNVKVNTVGGPASWDNVRRGQFTSTSVSGINYPGLGENHQWCMGTAAAPNGFHGYPQKNWNGASYVDLTSCKDTAVASFDIRIDNEILIENACAYLGETKSATTRYFVKIGDQYTVDDLGTWKKINIPVSEFVAAGFDPSKLESGGIAFDNTDGALESIEGTATMYYDNFLICDNPAPRKLVVTSATDSEVNLEWKEPFGEVPQFEILRTDSEGNTVSVDVIDSSNTTYTDNTVELRETYTYAVRSISNVGSVSINTNTVEAYISTVGSPQNFTAQSGFGDDLKVELEWEVPTYPSDLTDVTYNVYRQKSGEDTPELIETTTDTSFTDTEDTGMIKNTEYTYYVCSELDEEESMPSTKIFLAAAYIGKPQNVEATHSVADMSITLTWDAVDNAESYNVYRDGEKIATTEDVTYTNEDLEYEFNYIYEITAVCDTNESLPSDSVIEIIPDPAIDTSVQTIVFDERTQNGYSQSKFGGSDAGISDENYVMGELSYKVSFDTGTGVANGASFSKSGVNMKTLRTDGGLVSLFVYAQTQEMAEGVKVGFECTVSSRTVRASVDLEDYMDGRYGKWVYVQIPMSDFPEIGTYKTATAITPGYSTFNYASVNAMVIYTDEIHPQLDKTIYLDDIKFTQYVKPEITDVTYGEGTAITAGGTVASYTPITELNIVLNREMNSDTVTDQTVSMEENGAAKTVVVSSDGDTITLSIPSGLKSDSTYKLILNGAKSMEKGVANETFTFLTGTVAEVSAITFPEDAEGKMTVDAPSTAKKGETPAVKVSFADGVVREATVTSGTIVINYTNTVLTAYKTDVELSAALKAAGADLKIATGKITITIPAESNIVLGKDIATINFRTSATGKATITANAELTDTADTKLVLDEAKDTIEVKTVTTGQGQVSNGASSSASGYGGGRDTTPVNPDVSVTDTETGVGDKDLVFSDVKVDNWAKKHIEYLYEIKYISGYDDGTFRPDQSVSREEFLKMLLNAASVDTTDATTTFGDITADDWCYSVVAAAERDGIINGDNGNFGKGRSITREDMCTMVARAAEKYNIKLNVQYSADLFDDYNNISDYAQDSVTKLQTAGIINGMGDGTFAPKGEVTRAMAAKVIYEIVQLVVKG